jgi:hypothetical protein
MVPKLDSQGILIIAILRIFWHILKLDSVIVHLDCVFLELVDVLMLSNSQVLNKDVEDYHSNDVKYNNHQIEVLSRHLSTPRQINLGVRTSGKHHQLFVFVFGCCTLSCFGVEYS